MEPWISCPVDKLLEVQTAPGWHLVSCLRFCATLTTLEALSVLMQALSTVAPDTV